MDRVQQVRLELRAAERRPESATFRLFIASAWFLLGVVAIGMAILLVDVLAPEKSGLALGAGTLVGWPFFRLGRRHARRD
jgi:hypothetical protein